MPTGCQLNWCCCSGGSAQWASSLKWIHPLLLYYYHRSFRQLSVAASLLVQHCKPTLVGPLFALYCTHTHTHTQIRTHPHQAISFEWKWVLIYMALFIIQWQIQQLCQFLLPIFHFQYSFNAVDIAVARSLLSLPAYKIHFKTCMCVRGRQSHVSCGKFLFPVAVASCSCKLPFQFEVACAREWKNNERLQITWHPFNMQIQLASTTHACLPPSPPPLPACHCASCCMRRHFLCCCKAFAKFSLADLFVSFIARGIQISIQSLQAFHM